jgi:hypothetical protein
MEVRGLDVAVHDPERVRFCDRIACVDDPAHGASDGLRTFALEDVRQIAPGEELHDEEGCAVARRVDVEHPNGVRAREGARGARLPLEPRDELGMNPTVLPEHLERDLVPEPRVPRFEHRAHAASAEHALDHVLVRGRRRIFRFGEGAHARASFKGHARTTIRTIPRPPERRCRAPQRLNRGKRASHADWPHVASPPPCPVI